MQIDIEQAFHDGTLLHPLREDPSSVDLIRALAGLSGYKDFPERPIGAELKEQLGPADHYLFVLVDGLGMNQREAFPSGGFFSLRFTRQLRSVFPSTTAVALTSLATGAWPAEHGIAGWWTHFPERRRVIGPLLARERFTDLPIKRLGISLSDLISQPPIAPQLFRSCFAFYPASIARAPYAMWSRGGTRIIGYRNLDHAYSRIVRTLRRQRGPTFSYLYIMTVDSLSHDHGVRSSQVAEEIAAVDTLLSRLRDRLEPQIRFVVTADHGLNDVVTNYELATTDPLFADLLCAPSVEGTLPAFHVAEGKQEAFLEAFEASPLSEHLALVPTGELLGTGVLGPDEVGERTASRYGDFVGVGREVVALRLAKPGTVPHTDAAVHGGLRPAEIAVPLFLA